jgi:hypothetical protein
MSKYESMGDKKILLSKIHNYQLWWQGLSVSENLFKGYKLSYQKYKI